MRDTYHGATREELAEVRTMAKVRALADQSSLFPHHGDVDLTDSILDLAGWMTLRPEEILAVRHEFTGEYSRFTAGGARGGFPSLGISKERGAPLVLDLADGRQILLIVGFSHLSGTTKNADWYKRLTTFTQDR